MWVLTKHFVQAAAEYLTDVSDEQGAQGAAEVHGVAAADGENAEPAVVLQGHHGGGAHLLGLVLEQRLKLFAAQYAAHGLAGAQQRRQRLRQVVRIDEGKMAN